MLIVYIGKNGSGKTHKLNEECKNKKENGIFVPCASELLTMVRGEQNSNFLGTNGKINATYPNPIFRLIEIVLKKTKSKNDNLGKKLIRMVDQLEENKKWITEKIKNILYEKNEDNNTNDKDKIYEKFWDGLIKSYIETIGYEKFNKKEPYLFDILSNKNKFSPEKFSHGQLHFNIIKACVKLIKKYKLTELSLFLDEPDNYLNPELIDELFKLMMELEKCGVNIYLSSHNPYFITLLLNSSNIDCKIYEMTCDDTQKNNEKKYNCRQLKIIRDKYIPPSLLIYKVYKVYTIDLLDYFIGEIEEIWENEKRKIRFSGSDDEKIPNEFKNIKKVKDYFKDGEKTDYIENGKYKHHTLIHLIRNYYHHPKDRKDMVEDMNKKWKNSKWNIDELLKLAIEDIINLLPKKDEND